MLTYFKPIIRLISTLRRKKSIISNTLIITEIAASMARPKEKR